MKKKVLLLLILIIVLISCHGVLSNKQEKISSTPKYKKDFIIAQKSDVKTLDPQRSIDTVSNHVIDAMFEPLVKLDIDGNIQPALATSWERLDECTMLLHLREGVKFHNGDTLSPEDVKYSLEKAAVSPQTSYLLNMIKEVEIVDSNSVKIITSYPFGALLKHLASTAASIVNKKAATLAGEEFFKNPVGTGAFTFESWIAGDRITLNSFKDYWGEKPKVEKVIFRSIPEVSNRMIALETEEIDASFDIGIMDREALINHKDLALIEVESSAQLYLSFDQTNPLFKDIRVRQAISYAIDNKTLAEAVFRGSASPANSPLPSAVAGHKDIDYYEQNIELAKKLLAEAGYPNGFPLKLWVNDESTRVDMCVIIQGQLKEIGIDVDIEVFEWGTFLTKTLEHNKPLYLFSWSGSTGDADGILYPMFHSSQRDVSANRSNYFSPKVDSLLDMARTSIDEEKRLSLYKEAQEEIQKDLPHYTLVYNKLNMGINKKVKGLTLSSTGDINLADISILEN